MGETIAAVLWGFAEATFFFLVPDVLLSGIAILDWRLASIGCLASLVGALAGGAVMYHAGRAGGRVQRFLLRIPGISSPMLERVRDEVASRRFHAVLLGPLSGTPYKVYAVEAGRQGLSFTGFMLISIPARLIRFAAVTALAASLSHAAFPALPARLKLVIWLFAWTVFYLWYFQAMRSAARRAS